MLRLSRIGFRRAVLIPVMVIRVMVVPVTVVPIMVIPLMVAATMLAGCGDPVKVAKTAAELRSQVEAMLQRMELRNEVPGLQHRHVTVEPDSENGGYAVEIFDLKLGDATIGFQTFSVLTFNLTEDDRRFVAQSFKFMPTPVTDAPDSAAGMLVDHLKTSSTKIQVAAE